MAAFPWCDFVPFVVGVFNLRGTEIGRSLDLAIHQMFK